MVKKKMKILEYNAVFSAEKEGGYSVWVPSLPGCTSQGETFEEAVNNIKEAIKLYLESAPEMLEYGDEKSEKQFLVPIKVNYA